jgi:hypothetical protein
VRSAHQAFREALVVELLKDPLPKALKQVYVTNNTVLPNIRLTRPIGIHQQILGKWVACLFSRWSCVTKKGRSLKVFNKSANLHRKNIV